MELTKPPPTTMDISHKQHNWGSTGPGLELEGQQHAIQGLL